MIFCTFCLLHNGTHKYRFWSSRSVLWSYTNNIQILHLLLPNHIFLICISHSGKIASCFVGTPHNERNNSSKLPSVCYAYSSARIYWSSGWCCTKVKMEMTVFSAEVKVHLKVRYLCNVYIFSHRSAKRTHNFSYSLSSNIYFVVT